MRSIVEGYMAPMFAVLRSNRARYGRYPSTIFQVVPLPIRCANREEKSYADTAEA
jgi:hypothetical protein